MGLFRKPMDALYAGDLRLVAARNIGITAMSTITSTEKLTADLNADS